MNTLTRQTTNSPSISAPPADTGLADEISALKSSALEMGTALVLSAPISAELRVRLEQRQQVLRQSLQEGQRADLAMAVTDLVQAMTTARNLGEKQLQALVTSYVKELAGLSAWAVRQACQAIARGQVDGCSLDFPPTTARLRTVAIDVQAPVFTERLDIFRLLRAAVEYQPKPEERDAIAAGFAALQQKLGGGLQRMNAPPQYQPPSDADLVAHYAKEPAGE